VNESISIRERSLELSDLALFKTVAEAGGVTRAAHLSRLIAAELTTGEPRAELAPYRPGRFAAGHA